MNKWRNDDEVRKLVRDNYSKVAVDGYREESGCSTTSSSSCCGSASSKPSLEEISSRLGYSEKEQSNLPEGANMGLGCGNPTVIASLKYGETVLDLGAGGGIDVFLAAKKVGPEGQIIGVDMTPDMVQKSRENARKLGLDNVDFRLGEIERLPVADGLVDVIISNCVINLSPDKPAVFREAFRVLKEGGRLAVSDVVASAPIPESIKNDPKMLSGCIAGAITVDDLKNILDDAGFKEIDIEVWEESREFIGHWAPGSGIENYVVSAKIKAIKPA